MNRLPASPVIARALVPEYKFMRLVDILLEVDLTWVDWDEAKAPK
jgi:hypothetical protein